MRLHLILALITAFLLIITLRSKTGHHFTFAEVDKLAEQRAHGKYSPLPDVLPPQLKNLTPQQESGIFWKDAYRLWRKKGLPFQVDFYHISRDFPSGPRIHTVDRKGAHLLAYSPTFFNFGNLTFNPPLSDALPYAGFYLRYPVPTATESKPSVLNGFFSVLGGNYFRVLAADQVYGLSARALAVNTGIEGKPEEFPEFTDWWLHEPAPNATELVLDAVLDSPSLAGAYEFTIRPGSVTSVDVHASLYFRQAVARLGIVPFSSMFLYGENSKNHFGDNVHPEVHDSDGLIIHTREGQWIWRPLQQTSFLQLYDFRNENPQGFGLVQRDRDFKHYQDLEAKYNVRPSAWVTPHGDWGHGVIMLTQLPTNNTNTDNVVLFWRPDQPPAAGAHLDLDYTIDFYMNDAARPPLAYATETFINDPAPPLASAPSPPAPAALGAAVRPSAPAGKPGKTSPAKTAASSATTPVQFLVDFVGNGLENIPGNKPPDLDLSCGPPGTRILESKVEKNGYDNSWRVTFTLAPWKHNVPTEISCFLVPHDSLIQLQRELVDIQAQIYAAEQTNDLAAANNLRNNVLPAKEKELKDLVGRALTETWTYTWHQ
jgi:glucans biosynthesis protein